MAENIVAILLVPRSSGGDALVSALGSDCEEGLSGRHATVTGGDLILLATLNTGTTNHRVPHLPRSRQPG